MFKKIPCIIFRKCDLETGPLTSFDNLFDLSICKALSKHSFIYLFEELFILANGLVNL